MNTLRSPMRRHAAAADGAAMDGDELAEHVLLADDEPRRLARVLQVLRPQADRGQREHLVVVAELGVAVDHRRRADLAAPPDPDVRPDGGVRADRRAGADDRGRVDVGGRVDRDAVALERHHQRGLGDHLIVDQRLAGDPGDRSALGDQPHRQADPVAGHDLAAELDAVDAAQRGPRLERLAVAVEQQDRRGLGQRLEHQHARHHRLAREMALEEVLADRHALHRLERAAALVRDDGVHEGHRVAIGQPVERERGDGGHWDARTGGEGCAERRPAGTGGDRADRATRTARAKAATSSARPRRRRPAS